jgi:hypothetical protein
MTDQPKSFTYLDIAGIDSLFAQTVDHVELPALGYGRFGRNV